MSVDHTNHLKLLRKKREKLTDLIATFYSTRSDDTGILEEADKGLYLKYLTALNSLDSTISDLEHQENKKNGVEPPRYFIMDAGGDITPLPAPITKINVKLDDGAFLPERAHAEDAGLDLRSPVDLYLVHGSSWTLNTGVHVEIPKGYVGLIKSKSGLNVNHGILTEGVIDSGYTGAIRVKLYSLDAQQDYKIYRGDKIAQLVIVPCITPKCVIGEVTGGDRGNKGFGSTGR